MTRVHGRFDLPPRGEPVGGGISRTDQSFKDECDVNNIVGRYKQTGLFPSVAADGFFEDVSLIPGDLMAAKATIDVAMRAFGSLNADLRARFNNSYISLLQFLEDPANAAEARELGLFRKEAPPEPPKADSGTPAP